MNLLRRSRGTRVAIIVAFYILSIGVLIVGIARLGGMALPR